VVVIDEKSDAVAVFIPATLALPRSNQRIIHIRTFSGLTAVIYTEKTIFSTPSPKFQPLMISSLLLLF